VGQLSDHALRAKLGEGVRDYLAMDDARATPQERGELPAFVCEALAWVLQRLMEGEPNWDARYSWLDGIAPLMMTRTSSDSVVLDGAAYVQDGPRPRGMRPVHAELAMPPGRSRICFASGDKEVPFGPRWERHLVLPDDPTSWPHVFEFDLGQPCR
jgi:hypothetical protein